MKGYRMPSQFWQFGNSGHFGNAFTPSPTFQAPYPTRTSQGLKDLAQIIPADSFDEAPFEFSNGLLLYKQMCG
jgi:hypothetical protein